jgi:hypothetical protein
MSKVEKVDLKVNPFRFTDITIIFLQDENEMMKQSVEMLSNAQNGDEEKLKLEIIPEILKAVGLDSILDETSKVEAVDEILSFFKLNSGMSLLLSGEEKVNDLQQRLINEVEHELVKISLERETEQNVDKMISIREHLMVPLKLRDGSWAHVFAHTKNHAFDETIH